MSEVHGVLWLAFVSLVFSSLGVISLGLALLIYPRRAARWAVILMLVWIAATFCAAGAEWLGRQLRDLSAPNHFDLTAEHQLVFAACLLVPSALILVGLTRSRRTVAAVTVLMIALLCVNLFALGRQAAPLSRLWLVIAWHGGFAAIILTWAIYHRLRGSNPTVCVK